MRPSYVGVQIVYPQEFLKKLRKKIENKKEIGEVLYIKKTKYFFEVKTTKNLILCKKIVFCTGGLRAKLSSLFKDEAVLNNAFKIAENIGCKTAYLNKVMTYPFYFRKKCLATDNLFGFIITDANHQKLPITNYLIESHNAHFCFDKILKETKKTNGNCFAIKGKIKIKLNSAPHYRLGGILINKNGQTNIKNIYALGECAFGMHGLGRVGGCSLSEIIVMARIISQKFKKII